MWGPHGGRGSQSGSGDVLDVSDFSGVPPPPSAALEEMHWMEGTMPHWKGEGKPYLVPSTLPEVLALASRRIMGDWWTGPEGFQDCGGWGRAGAPGWLREGRESCIVRPGIGL